MKYALLGGGSCYIVLMLWMHLVVRCSHNFLTPPRLTTSAYNPRLGCSLRCTSGGSGKDNSQFQDDSPYYVVAAILLAVGLVLAGPRNDLARLKICAFSKEREAEIVRNRGLDSSGYSQAQVQDPECVEAQEFWRRVLEGPPGN
eukprot:TRINITY_DN63419_c0_g1_i1.p1 TRINITY_DN63419_c0_g1~~TRINITY_DN63419_c0_g1_i1.p1  ORF type:complete len:144 (-),score=14.46 TRINITY_DN63419_c0_g1_i1:77-508(-)